MSLNRYHIQKVTRLLFKKLLYNFYSHFCLLFGSYANFLLTPVCKTKWCMRVQHMMRKTSNRILLTMQRTIKTRVHYLCLLQDVSQMDKSILRYINYLPMQKTHRWATESLFCILASGVCQPFNIRVTKKRSKIYPR
jgi:hypothetical protein